MRYLSTAFCLVAALTCLPAWAGATQQDQLKIEVKFKEADTNSDNKLSKDELSTHLISSIAKQLADEIGKDQAEQVAKQTAPRIVKTLFEKGDANFDGFLTKEELKAAG